MWPLRSKSCDKARSVRPRCIIRRRSSSEKAINSGPSTDLKSLTLSLAIKVRHQTNAHKRAKKAKKAKQPKKSKAKKHKKSKANMPKRDDPLKARVKAMEHELRRVRWATNLSLAILNARLPLGDTLNGDEGLRQGLARNSVNREIDNLVDQARRIYRPATAAANPGPSNAQLTQQLAAMQQQLAAVQAAQGQAPTGANQGQAGMNQGD